MNSALASIGKNIILIAVVLLSAFNFLYGWLNWKDLIGIQSLAGLAYVFLSCYEYLNTTYKASLPVQRYPYFTNKFIMTRSLKICIFIAFAILLFFSKNNLKYIYPICLIVAATEIIILYLRIRKGLCFVNIYANYLLIVESKFTKLFASEIMIIEFRHDIFYFVKKNRKTISIKLEHIRERGRFIQGIQNWINRNNILVSTESQRKIKELIA